MADKRIVVITGVTRGLGRAMTEEFIRLGHTVLGCGRSQSEIDDLNRKFGKSHRFERVDVASDAAVQSWAGKCLSSHGPPDLLLNNAAVINRNARLWEVSAEDFAQVINVNVNGTVNVLRHFV